MLTQEAGNIIAISTIVGFLGDGSLQLLTHYGMGGESGWGLNEYFAQHGRAEATFIAGGMLGLFAILFALTGLRFTIQNMIIYGILLDLLFRLTGIFPSLNGYYNSLNYFWSAVWGVIPLVIPLIIYKILEPTAQIF
jgi:hypothetical protein